MRELDPAWPPGALGLQDEHVEPLRGRVDRGGEAGGPGADDDHVVHVPVVVRRVEPEAAATSATVGFRSARSVAADQHGHVVEAELEAGRAAPARPGPLDVEVGVGDAVARQELLQAQRVRASGWSR